MKTVEIIVKLIWPSKNGLNWLFDYDGEEYWMPLSLIFTDEQLEEGKTINIEIPEWKAKLLGII